MTSNKEDLRRLMREKMNTQQDAQSPYAKTTSSGKLICVICPGVPIKNWSTHQISAQHKRSLVAQKSAKTESFRRPLTPPSVKESVPLTDKAPTKSILKNPLRTTTQTPMEVTTAEPQTLKRSAPESANDEEPESKTSKLSNDFSALPQGFFDDPKLDAKARNIEYRDPKEAEWESFQKALREEDNKSEQVVEVDEEREMRERELYETDQMISNWEKVRQLEIRKELLVTKGDTSQEEEAMDDEDESTFDEFLSWRQKAVN